RPGPGGPRPRVRLRGGQQRHLDPRPRRSRRRRCPARQGRRTGRPVSAPRVALVTGSGSGIGEGIARGLAAAGFTVVVNSASSVDAGERLAAELPGASYVQADVADPDDAVRLVET